MRSIRIPLHSRKYPGMFAIIDEADAELVSQFVWIPSLCDGKWYVQAWDKSRKRHIYLHRFLTGARRRRRVDHVNHDGLDNRRENLRVCSNAQNMWNRKGPQRNNRSGYIGVYRKRSKWSACICTNGKTRYLGVYETPEEAARVRDAAAKKYHGQFAALNFPDEAVEDGVPVLPFDQISA